MDQKKSVFSKRFMAAMGALALMALVLVFGAARAADGPKIQNVNPQGTVTSSTVKITLETEDLARCRYSTSDAGYDSMGNDMDTPDGLYHSGTLGTLAKGSYTYYVRCRDFEGNANGESVAVKFSAGEITCLGDNCPTTSGGGTPPVLSNFLPQGTTTSKYVVLSVTTDKEATCRYSWYNRTYDEMKLAFSSSNKLYHLASTALSNGGMYTYYVRCKDAAGNINDPAGQISFYYSAPYVPPAPVTPVTPVEPVVKTPADAAAPAISGCAPSGQVNSKKVEISCVTDEAAHCKFGTVDAEYDSLTDKFEVPGSIVSLDPAGTSHKKTVELGEPGQYDYYVRCVDEKNNKNEISTKVSFEYVLPEGPEISDIQPEGTIYQETAPLLLSTNKTATCRYAEEDIPYDEMTESFDTNDGALHQATVELPDFGEYTYYARCADSDGFSNKDAAVINFVYENPNPEEEKTEEEPVNCETTQKGSQDGACDTAKDCVCDPDCPAEGADIDADCANLPQTEKKSGGSGWVAFVLIFLILLIIAAIIIIIMRRRGQQEEDVELP